MKRILEVSDYQHGFNPFNPFNPLSIIRTHTFLWSFMGIIWTFMLNIKAFGFLSFHI